MPVLDPDSFDQARPIVLARSGKVAGHDLRAGAPVAIVAEPAEPGEVTLDQARFLWGRGIFVYAGDLRPTPVESPQDAARRLVSLEELGGGWWMIRAPWLVEPEKLQDEQAARDRRDQLIAAGQPTEAAAKSIEQPAPAPPSPPAPPPPAPRPTPAKPEQEDDGKEG